MPDDDLEDEKIILEAKDNFQLCVDWEAEARTRFDYDHKFANADPINMFQWDSRLVAERGSGGQVSRPCITINKTQQHNLMIINDAKQNKPGVNVRPVGEDASYEAAQIFQEVIRHIEYISNAENVYDHATVFQVEAGIGYWRIEVDFIASKSFDQEIYIKPIKDPRSVYLDCDISEADGSDARYGFIFDDIAKVLFDKKYPEFKDIVGWSTTFDNAPDPWLQRDNIRIAEYYRKTEKKDRYIMYIEPETGKQVFAYYSELKDEQKAQFDAIKHRESNLDLQDQTYRERKVVTDEVEWFKIAGNKIIDRGPWKGKYIPIVRLPGTETVIDGILDRKGHTRAMIDAQRIYNWNTSANQEFGALQTKSPWVVPIEAIDGHEAIWGSANTVNHAWLPYNGLDEDGNQIPAPSRPAAPQSSPAYVEQMKIAQNEMMMVSGQYQAQMGENENAKSGVAINARQRQGDRATYHFIDNNAIAVRYTGKQLIDLIPKIYNAKRVMQISAVDGTIFNLTVDPNAEQAFQKTGEAKDSKGQKIVDIIFNPNVGIYDVISEVGPSFATRRQEAFNALTQIAAQNEKFMDIAGDILWKVADFPEAQILAERWRKMIPPNLTGDAPDPQTEQAMHAASDRIEQLLAVIAKQTKDLEDKGGELSIKATEADTKHKTAASNAHRLDYEAETTRLVALGNSGPAVTKEQIEPLVKQLVRGMLNAGEPGAGDNEPLTGHSEGGTPLPDENAPVPGAQQAPDGKWYVKDPNRAGKYLMVNDKQAV